MSQPFIFIFLSVYWSVTSFSDQSTLPSWKCKIEKYGIWYLERYRCQSTGEKNKLLFFKIHYSQIQFQWVYLLYPPPLCFEVSVDYSDGIKVWLLSCIWPTPIWILDIVYWVQNTATSKPWALLVWVEPTAPKPPKW